MPRYNCFGATHDDVLRRLPAGVPAPSAEALDAALEAAEARVEAAMPEGPARLLRRVEGEVIVPSATEGQLSAAIGLPAASGLVLYADLDGPYADRSPDDAMDPNAYELAPTGDYVTFSPGLRRGTRIVADYDTSLEGGLRVLADLAAALAAAELAATGAFGRPGQVAAMADQAATRLEALAAGRLRVPELDALRLYDDTERAASGIRCGRLVRS